MKKKALISFLSSCRFFRFLFLILFIVLTSSAHAQVTKRMYFIGNSVTDGMNYDGVKAMAESRSYTHIWARHMIPGSPLYLLWEARANPDLGGFYELPYGNEVNAFANYDWDAITLQPFDRAIYDPYDASQGDSINCANYANLAVPRNPNVQFYIYGRYPRTPNDVVPTHNSLTADSWNNLHLGNFTDIYDGSVETRMYYEKLTRACNNSGITNKPFLIIPVGEVMLSLNNKMKAGQVPGYTKIWQFYADGIHMNNIGSFMVGCTFYSTIYKESPVGLPVPSQYGTISSSLATIIQQTVWEVVSSYQYAGISGSSTIAVSSLSLSNISTTISVGQNFQLTASILPSNATNQTVTWSSSNNNVATVNPAGSITGVSAGSTTITATSNNGKTATCSLNVIDGAIAVTGVSISNNTLNVKVGNSTTLAATIAPANATNQNVTWISSNSSVATVDATGKISSIAVGTATITVTTDDGNRSATCLVTSLPNAAPIAVISATPISGSAPLLVSFNSVNSYDTDNGDFILGYEWDFGDGSAIDKSTAPTHTYLSAGNYNVKLRVMDNNNLFGLPTSINISVLPELLQTNIATSGTGSVWQNIPAATSTSNTSKVNKIGINNANLTTNITLTDVTAVDNWQAAGVTWATSQNGITSVKFYNGTTTDIAQQNGVFADNIKIQYSTNGTTWADASGWSITPSYSYNSTAASNQVYTLSGPALDNIRGLRVVGQLRLSSNQYGSSWALKVKEVEVFVPTSIAVTGVSVNPTSTSINVGSSVTLTATVAPSNATNANVTWSSSNSAIAAVSATGVVTGLAVGSAIITVTTQDGALTATSNVTVAATSGSTNLATLGLGFIWQDIPAASSTSDVSKVANTGINNLNVTTDVVCTDVSLANNWQAAGINWVSAQNGITSVKFYNGTTSDIAQENGVFAANMKLQSSVDGINWSDVSGWSITPAYSYNSIAASNQIYTFSGPAINNIKGLRVVGQLRLSTNEYGSSWALKVKEIEVYAGPSVAVMGVNVNPTSASVNVGFTTVLTATVAPSNATNKNLTWSSSNSAIATVSATGVVTGLAVGSAIITASTQDGAKTATSAITVTAAPINSRVNMIGMNLGNPGSYFSEDIAFADAMKSTTHWKNASGNLATTDANYWPTEDANVIVFSKPGNSSGTYKLSFDGPATVSVGGGIIQNYVYNSTTNKSTADIIVTDVTMTGTLLSLDFSNTTGGIKNVKLMRPITSGSSTSYATNVIFTDFFKNAIAPYKVLRSLGWVAVNWSPDSLWSDRTLWSHSHQSPNELPGRSYGWEGRGACWESLILLANETNKDVWVNVPAKATNDYITKLAQLFKYGSDGVNPYTSTQANPVLPPLNPNLKVYVEYSNEIWNGQFSQTGYVYEQSVLEPANSPIRFDNETDETTLSLRYKGMRCVQISDIFRTVYGDQDMMTKVRPVIAWQLAYGDLTNRLLSFIDRYYGKKDSRSNFSTPHPVNYYFYGGGGSFYWYSDPDATLNSNTLWNSAGWNATAEFNDPWGNPYYGFIGQTTTDASWAKHYGLSYVCYEGDNHPTYQNNDEAIMAATHWDPRMKQNTLDHLNVLNQVDCEFGNFLSPGGSGSNNYWSILNYQNEGGLGSPQWDAINQWLAATPQVITVGSMAPFTRAGNSYNCPNRNDTQTGSTVLTANVTPDYTSSYTFRVPSDGTYNVKVDYSTSSSAKLEVEFNGKTIGTYTLANTSGVSTLTLPANFAASTNKLNAIRLVCTSGAVTVNNVIVETGNVNGMQNVKTVDGLTSKPLFSVHPNPSIDFVNIGFEDDTERTVSLYSINGSKLFETNLNGASLKLDISTYTNGIYLLKVVSGSQTTFGKIIKK